MPILNVLTLLLLAAFTVFGYLRYRDVLYPPFIQATVWLIVIALYFLSEDAFLPLLPQTYFIIVNGVFLFSLGGYIATWQHRLRGTPIEFREQGADRLMTALLWISILGLPVFLHRAMQMAAGGATGMFLMDLRTAVTKRNGAGFGPWGYLVPLSLISVALHLLYKGSSLRSRVRMMVAIVIALGYAVLMTGRTSLFLTVVLITGVLLITRRVSVQKVLPWAVATMLLAFAVMAAVMLKGADPRASLVDNAISLGASFRLYLLGGIPAFDRLMRSGPEPLLGKDTFRSVLTMTTRLGIDTPTPPPLILDFIKTPLPTNVYTVYQPYFADFSYLGVVLIQFVLGVWHGYLYRKADDARPLFICLYAVFLYPLLMQFFSDQYLPMSFLVVLFLIYFSFCRNHVRITQPV